MRATILLLILAVAAVPVLAQQLDVSARGDGTVVVVLPANQSCLLYYRALGDAVEVPAGNLSGTVELRLPWGKYVFRANCSGAELYGVVDNAPRWRQLDGMFAGIAVLAFTALHLWRRAALTFALAMLFFTWYAMEYLAVFAAEAQLLLLFAYLMTMLLITVYRRG